MKIPDKPPDFLKIVEKLIAENKDMFFKILSSTNPSDSKGRYLHWDKLKYLELPNDYHDHQIWWTTLKFARKNQYKVLPISGINKIPFKYVITDNFQRILHFLDQYASGNIGINEPILNTHLKNTYLISSLYEESITSSQLEGASTTREVAKKMLREGRRPKDKSEKMIYNNFNAMQFIRSIKKESLTLEIIKELHKILTEGTLDDSSKSGAFRNGTDDIHIIVDNDKIVFTPPDYKEIEKRINQLCHIANEPDFSDHFVHPVIKSVILHFYLSYIHPFIDGNGRTARALFYWSMLKNGYWLTEFISISRILKNAPSKYGLSYLYTETDDNDLSYFIDYQLKVIKRSIEELHLYIKKKIYNIESISKLIRSTKLSNKLNPRQLSILKHAIKRPGYIYTINEHKNTHAIAYDTSRKDLLDLSDKYELLIKVKEGKGFIFLSPSNIEERIKKLN